ncbi:MAG TPA: histidine triad nucleotide-binding protein [Thermomicrobiaceae bacterium]|nr:histidine triad nucleotide-binding protein [Thermomicrobiaceae bacterium]
MDPTCLFCRILAGTVPARIVHQDDRATVFQDIQPQASTHLLVIPNEHIASLNEAEETDLELLGHLLRVAAWVAREAGIDRSGYRVVINTGPDSGQSVFHLHLHVLGGNRLHLPLG